MWPRRRPSERPKQVLALSDDIKYFLFHRSKISRVHRPPTPHIKQKNSAAFPTRPKACATFLNFWNICSCPSNTPSKLYSSTPKILLCRPERSAPEGMTRTHHWIEQCWYRDNLRLVDFVVADCQPCFRVASWGFLPHAKQGYKSRTWLREQAQSTRRGLPTACCYFCLQPPDIDILWSLRILYHLQTPRRGLQAHYSWCRVLVFGFSVVIVILRRRWWFQEAEYVVVVIWGYYECLGNVSIKIVCCGRFRNW